MQIEGIFTNPSGQSVQKVLAADEQGRLRTVMEGGQIASEVEIKNDAGNPVPTEPLGTPTQAWQLAVTTAAGAQTLSAGCRRVSMRARGCDIRYLVTPAASSTGANASTSHFIAQDERLDIAVPAGSRITAIREAAATANGSLAITELG